MRAKYLFFVAAIFYLALLMPLSAYMKRRPVIEKLGYLPEAKILKYMVADHRALVAEWGVLKVLFYYGGLFREMKGGAVLAARPEYQNMFRMLQTALRLDPYNSDAYYFAQAAFTWEVGRYKEVNNLLEYGTRYRRWDYQLPFYIGFNCAYFLNDYPKAAEYMQKAAELSGEPLFATLAARYFYEAGNEELGIVFIETMIKGAKDEKVRNIYKVRKEALLAIQSIKSAVAAYRQRFGVFPRDLQDVVEAGLLKRVPDDPYGGRFYIFGNGEVRSTSNLAFARNPTK